jgi:hypothetical protein
MSKPLDALSQNVLFNPIGKQREHLRFNGRLLEIAQLVFTIGKNAIQLLGSCDDQNQKRCWFAS